MSDSAVQLLNSDFFREWIKSVIDPDLGISLVDLGLIYAISPLDLGEGNYKVEVTMTLTSPMCPSAGYLRDQIEGRLKEHTQVKEVVVNLVFEPKWDPHTMATDEVKDRLGIW